MTFRLKSYANVSRNYSAFGAPTGQTPSQAPHSMHVSASITYVGSPAEIASTGHSAAQAPQAMHSSPILYAIEKAPPTHFMLSFYHVLTKLQVFLEILQLSVVTLFCFSNVYASGTIFYAYFCTSAAVHLAGVIKHLILFL